jgi:hypothetical protein
LPSDDHDVSVMLERPGTAGSEPVDVGYIGADQRGVSLSDLYQRGIYRVVARRSGGASDDPPVAAQVPSVWDIPLAVNGSSDESQIEPLGREKFDAAALNSPQLRWIGPGDEISLAGAAIRGQFTWWWLTLAVLAFLLGEMLILSWPALKAAPVATTEGS